MDVCVHTSIKDVTPSCMSGKHPGEIVIIIIIITVNGQACTEILDFSLSMD